MRKGSSEGMESYYRKYRYWFTSGYVEEDALAELSRIKDDEKAIEDRFCKLPEFGTAGLRSVMRFGLNGINVYTVRLTTQALSDVIKESGEDYSNGVCIAFDSRNHSREFAREAAMTLAANDIKANLFDQLRPTPELSFAVRHTGSIAGINITASHNTKEYNGYKVYWKDGAQIDPDLAEKISNRMNELDIFRDVKTISFRQASTRGLIEYLDTEMDNDYISEVTAQSIGKKYVQREGKYMTIVYTPLHGAGYKMVPRVLRQIGIENVIPVKEQMEIDGNFPTVKSPNPENREAFELGLQYAEKNDADLIIATDPDSDRCGVAVKHGDEYVLLTGNQIGCLLLDFIIKVEKEEHKFAENSAAVCSIVSTPMADKICEKNGVKMFRTLTGFKYIGEKIKEFEESGDYTFLFGFEESYGFLKGTYARDKDAVVAAMLIAEMACYYQARRYSLYQALQELYKEYGYYEEKVTSIEFDGTDASDKMKAVMEALRNDKPDQIGLKVLRIRDYLTGDITDLSKSVFDDTPDEKTGLPKSDVLYFELENGCNAIFRPSGTEPKIKLYVMARGDSQEEADTLFDLVQGCAVAMLAAGVEGDIEGMKEAGIPKEHAPEEEAEEEAEEAAEEIAEDVEEAAEAVEAVEDAVETAEAVEAAEETAEAVEAVEEAEEAVEEAVKEAVEEAAPGADEAEIEETAEKIAEAVEAEEEAEEGEGEDTDNGFVLIEKEEVEETPSGEEIVRREEAHLMNKEDGSIAVKENGDIVAAEEKKEEHAPEDEEDDLMELLERHSYKAENK
jgi:phosphoglucomutase